jgi:hypothetical protein
VNVYVITGVAMPGGMLLDARLKATSMFREIGVNLRLRMGRPAHDSNDTCSARILIQLEPTTRYPVPPDALPYKDGGTCIHVFPDRVSLNRTQTFANALLGLDGGAHQSRRH